MIACVLMIQTFACYVYTACLSPNLPMETAMGLADFEMLMFCFNVSSHHVNCENISFSVECCILVPHNLSY